MSNNSKELSQLWDWFGHFLYSHTGTQTVLINVPRVRQLELLLAMKAAGYPWSAPASLQPPNKVTLQRTSGCSTGIVAQRRWVLLVSCSSSQSAGNKTDGTLDYSVWGNSENNTHVSNQALGPDRWNKSRLTTGTLVLILFLVLYRF